MIYNKIQLQELFGSGPVSFSFRKLNGEIRNMIATLDKSLMPDQRLLPEPLMENIDPVKQRKLNDNILAVWDLEKKEFRSFRIDSIESIGETA